MTHASVLLRKPTGKTLASVLYPNRGVASRAAAPATADMQAVNSQFSQPKVAPLASAPSYPGQVNQQVPVGPQQQEESRLPVVHQEDAQVVNAPAAFTEVRLVNGKVIKLQQKSADANQNYQQVCEMIEQLLQYQFLGAAAVHRNALLAGVGLALEDDEDDGVYLIPSRLRIAIQSFGTLEKLYETISAILNDFSRQQTQNRNYSTLDTSQDIIDRLMVRHTGYTLDNLNHEIGIRTTRSGAALPPLRVPMPTMASIAPSAPFARPVETMPVAAATILAGNRQANQQLPMAPGASVSQRAPAPSLTPPTRDELSASAHPRVASMNQQSYSRYVAAFGGLLVIIVALLLQVMPGQQGGSQS